MKERYVKKIIKKSEIETVKVNTNAKRTIHNLKKKKQDKINFQIQNQIRTQKGITLLALVITIIVLLILAGITINAITGDNGIIGNAGRAKEEAEIANEKDILEKATVQAMGNNKYGNIEEEELQEQLDKETGERKTEATDVGEEFEVLFKESNRYYAIDKDGNVGEANIYEEDKYPGDITVGKNGEKLDGNTEETAYQIWCIEDLVSFCNMVNGEGIRLENGEAVPITYRNSFASKYVVLKANLNFKSKLSYQNSERTDFGDINGNTEDGNTLINEMTTGTGFKPIGTGGTFAGNFNGESHELKNIYINRPESTVGLFGAIGGTTNKVNIQNIMISGNMIGSTGGGIVGYVNMNSEASTENPITIQNCTNNATIETTDTSGGIVGYRSTGNEIRSLIIANCTNNGTIEGTTSGGIIGMAYEIVKIINCCNNGSIINNQNGSGYAGTGGIVGTSMFKIDIINCYNLGNIESKGNAGGIIGYSYWAEKSIENCYSIGKISGSVAGGIIGGLNLSNDLLTTKNCYYLNTNISKGIGGWNSSAETLEDIQGITDTEMQSSETLEVFNQYVAENKTKEGIDLKAWIKGEKGYPTF